MTTLIDRSFATTGSYLCMSCTLVDRAVYQPHRSTARSTRFCLSLLQSSFLLPLTFDLCAISSLPTSLHLGEDFSNLSRTPMNIWRNRHTISAKSTHDLNLANRRNQFLQNKSPTQVQLISTDLTSVNHLEGGE